MNNIKKFVFQGIIVFSVAAIVLLSWGMVITPEFEKLSKDYFLDMEYDAQTTMVDDVYGELLGPYFQRDILSEKVIETNGNILTIKSSVTGTRIDTNEIMFQVENIYKVDAITQMHTDREGKRFGFLPGVEKKDYEFFHPAVFYDDPMMFKKTDIVNGLEVYVFEVITKGADTSRAFPQFAPHVIFTDTTSRLWIEPITGNLVKFEKDWDNYLIEDGKRINTIQIGGKHTTEFTELILTQYTKAKIENIKFNNFFMPIFLLVVIFSIGIIWILLTYLGKIKQESVKKEQMAIIGKFSARLTHDLRNPLSVIYNEITILRSQAQNKNSTFEPSFKRLERSADRMKHQIDDVLDFVKSKPPSLKSVSLKTLLESAIDNSNIPSTIKITKPTYDFHLNLDYHQMEIVLTNLLTNAIQAIGEKGEIIIKFKEERENIRIEIIDSGSGILEKDLEKVFESLFTTKQKGTGLGLASCKNIIENHKGKISVKNNPTTFTIILPKF